MNSKISLRVRNNFSRNFRRNFSLFALTALSALTLVISPLPGAWAQPVCVKAELFAGNPNYAEPKDRAKAGQGLLDDPPLAWRTLLFAGNKLVTAVGQELWFADLTEAKPTLKRLAGLEDRTGQSLKPGSGSEARFANISGLALMSDGSIVGADQTGNGIFIVKDPFGPGCNVSFVAGTTQAVAGLSPGNLPNVGDVDGPGVKARFELPEWPAVIGEDVFFIDEGTGKLKKMGGDAAHTVKTIAKLPDGTYYSMISMGGKLYTLANNTKSEGFVCEIDPASGAIREVIRGHSDDFESDGAINVSGLATDGKGLFLCQSGQLLYLTLAGKVSSLAGTGDWFDYRGGYDPTKTQKPDRVQLVSTRRLATAGSNVFLAYKDGAIYFCGANTTPYIEKLTFK